MALLGVDTGGTFTDFILYDNNHIKVHKVLSTPAAPAEAILKGISDLSLDFTNLKVIHGSTVATNAVLEGKGVKTVYVTNKGLKDVLLIGRQARRSLYDLQPKPVFNPVQQSHCLEIDTRTSSSGELLREISDDALEELFEQIKKQKPESVAINLLFSFIDDSMEKKLEAAFTKHWFVSRSSQLLPEYKEYERGMTTWLNGYVGPLVQNYLMELQDKITPSKLSVMMSSGGTSSAQQAGVKAVNMLLSGPAGGLQASKHIGQVLNYEKLLTFDMGGTSTDVSLIDGDIKLSSDAKIAGLPVAVPMVDMHTIGAGGGSIATVDEGGMLQVGPASAGAVPGPACYDNGGLLATVTDANVVLGRLPSGIALAGSLQLDYERASDAVDNIAKAANCTLYEAANGILAIANEHMVQALRLISVQKGFDPQEFTLISFGGAGGLHVCDIAESLGVTTAIVPVNAGVFSAFGMLVSPISRELSKANIGILADFSLHQINEKFEKLLQNGMLEMASEGVDLSTIRQRFSMDLRYKGQSYMLNVDWRDMSETQALFHATHLKRYGHKLEVPVELINLRVSLKTPTESLKSSQLVEKKLEKSETNVLIHNLGEVPVWYRKQLSAGQVLNGSVLIIEDTTTVLINSNWRCEVAKEGHLKLIHQVKCH